MDFNDFSTEFSVQENEVKNLKESIKERNEVVDKRLEKHSDRIDKLELDFTYVQHCKYGNEKK